MVARRLRVKAEKVVAWIRSGQLRALNVSNGTRPRFRIDPADLAVFSALFASGDWILFRPIETWTDGGRKRSRIDYRGQKHRVLTDNLPALLYLQIQRSERERTNVFFGVCPRFGGWGQFGNRISAARRQQGRVPMMMGPP
jgi:hypothetical protein